MAITKVSKTFIQGSNPCSPATRTSAPTAGVFVSGNMCYLGCIHMPKDFSIEYAHIYTNSKIGDEHKMSLDVLGNLGKETKLAQQTTSLVVMVDDYSFPDPSFDYDSFLGWLSEAGYSPDLTLRESQLIPLCDEVIKLIEDHKLVEQISDYIRAKKYPCSLFIATWYLLRLGHISSPIFNPDFISKKLINILPISFKPFEDKALEIIQATKFSEAGNLIEYRYFEGRLLA